MKTSFLVIFSLFYIQFVYSQNNVIDSLSRLINIAQNDSNKVLLILELGDEIGETDLISAIAKDNEAKDLAVKIGYSRGIAKALKSIGIRYYFLGEYVEALSYWGEAKEQYLRIGDLNGVANMLSNMGAVYHNHSEYSKAVDLYLQAQKIAEYQHDTLRIGTVLQNIGAVHSEKGDYVLAMESYTEALHLFESVNYVEGIGLAYLNIGEILHTEEKYEEALKNYNSALKYLGNSYYAPTILRCIGTVCYKLYGFDTSIVYLDSAYNVANNSGDIFELVRTMNEIALTYENEKNYSKSLYYFEKGKSILMESDKSNVEVLISTRGLVRIYANSGDYKKAFENLLLLQSVNDSIYNIQSDNKISQLLFSFDLEKKESEISLLVKDNEIKVIETNRQKQQKKYLYAGLGITALFGLFIFNRFRVTRKQNVIIQEQKKKVDGAYEKLEEKNQEILDSISYAKRIQRAILPSNKLVKEYLRNSFIFYLPKDIVAGDFYWMEPQKDRILFAVADCTGHGVPGALVSVICNNGLNRSVREYGLIDPAQILNKTREIVISEFEKSEEEVKDGMDIALCSLKDNVLHFAGANNPLWIIRKNSHEVEEIKADKQPIGKYAEPKPFASSTISLNKGDSFYIFSDGYADQFGGDKGKKFKAANFKSLLLSIQNLEMDEQRHAINDAFESWKGNLEQLDDICVIGVRV